MRKALSLALATAALVVLGGDAAPGKAVPWGYSCVPQSAGVARISATCGATLTDGRATAPPELAGRLSNPAFLRRVAAALG